MNGRQTTEDTDAEGNSMRKIVKDGVEDDTEGNMPLRKVAKDGVEDDTEGNTIKSGRSVPTAANPGKVIRVRS